MRADKAIKRGLALGLASTCVLAILFHTHDARADWDFQFATNVNGAWVRETPGFSTKEQNIGARDLRASSLLPSRSLSLLGFQGDMEVTVDDRWKIPIAGGSLMWAVGSYDGTVTSIDGSIARVRPWTAFRGEILLPGVGRRWKQRRFMFGVSIRTGVSWLTMDGSVAGGADSKPLDLNAGTFLVQAEIEGCRRLDPETRVCLQVVPRLYDHSWLNGVTLGLRMEWGR